MAIQRRGDKLQPPPKWPWNRQPGESEAQHRAFMAYRDMGGQRSFARLARKYAPEPGPGKHRQPQMRDMGFRDWCHRFEWVTRCRAWDNFVQDQKDRKLSEGYVKWEKRKLDHAERTYNLGETLEKKALEMFEVPLIETIEEQDGKIVVKKPAKWTMQTARDMIVASVEIRTLAIASATAHEADELSEATVDAMMDAHFDPAELADFVAESEKTEWPDDPEPADEGDPPPPGDAAAGEPTGG